MLDKIISGDETITGLYSKIKQDKNTPRQKVQMNFFDLDDGICQVIRCDDAGGFYFRDYEKRKEAKAFRLLKFIDNPRIRERIVRVIEEEIGDSMDEKRKKN